MADETESLTDFVQRIGGSTLVFNLVAGVVHQHDERIGEVEQRDV